MLDTVPDNVLVCKFAQNDDDLKPSPLYNNRQMRQFFGGCLVTDEKRNRAERKKKNPNKIQMRKMTKF